MTSFAKLLSFLNRLDQVKIAYSLGHNRAETIMVIIDVPGQRWEIEFFEDGTVEVEKFISTGVTGNGENIEELFSKFAD